MSERLILGAKVYGALLSLAFMTIVLLSQLVIEFGPTLYRSTETDDITYITYVQTVDGGFWYNVDYKLDPRQVEDRRPKKNVLYNP